MNKRYAISLILLCAIPLLGMNQRNSKRNRKKSYSPREEVNRQMSERLVIKENNLSRWKDSLVEIELMSNNVDIIQNQINKIHRDYFSRTKEADENLDNFVQYKIENPREKQLVEIELDNIVRSIRNFNLEFDNIKTTNNVRRDSEK